MWVAKLGCQYGIGTCFEGSNDAQEVKHGTIEFPAFDGAHCSIVHVRHFRELFLRPPVS